MQQWRLDPEGSSIVVEARSSMGPIAWEVTGPQGDFEVDVVDGVVAVDPQPQGALEIQLDRLRSGNDLYDAELRKRLDVRRHPLARVELLEATVGGSGVVQAAANMTMHGVTHAIHGLLEVTVADDGFLRVQGQQRIDIRAFDIPAPQMLMLRIFPEVQVHLFLRGSKVGADAHAG